jgi:hypothetical protein
LGQFNIEGRDLENERLELGAKNLYFLGPNLTLRSCTLVVNVPAADLVLIGPRLIGCTIEVKRELKNLPWHHAFLQGCRFTGRLSGCDFGRWPESQEGGIADCDFSAARLDACRFIGCDASTLTFPSWPCFTLLDPARRSHELTALPWPGELGIVARTFSKYPPSTAAVTFSASLLAKEFRTSEASIRAVLEGLDGVTY